MERRVLWGTGLLIGAVYLYFVWPIFRLTMGDGFIVAHYAENLIDHGELAFNLGERIWSFTSPLHVLLEAAFYWMTGETLIVNKVASIVAVVLGAWLLVRFVCESPGEKLLAWILLLLSPCLVYWTVNGLETAYLFLAIAGLVVFMHRSSSRRPTPRDVAICSALSAVCVLLRYDAVLVVFPAVIFTLARARLSGKSVAALSSGIVPVLAWVGFAFLYYRAILPTSFFLKTPSLDRAEVIVNLKYEVQFLLLSGILLVGCLYLGRRGSGRGTLKQHAWLFVSLILFFAYGLTAATKHMMFGYRLLLPLLPAMFCAMVVLGRSLPFAGARTLNARVVVLCVVAFALQSSIWRYLMVRGVNPTLSGEFDDFDVRDMLHSSDAVWESMARQLDAHWKKHGTPGVQPRMFTFEAGQIPYLLKYMYVYDPGLITYRSRCRVNTYAAAHYIIMPADRSMPLPIAAVSQTHVFRYQARPQPHVLPVYADEPCRPPK